MFRFWQLRLRIRHHIKVPEGAAIVVSGGSYSAVLVRSRTAFVRVFYNSFYQWVRVERFPAVFLCAIPILLIVAVISNISRPHDIYFITFEGNVCFAFTISRGGLVSNFCSFCGKLKKSDVNFFRMFVKDVLLGKGVYSAYSVRSNPTYKFFLRNGGRVVSTFLSVSKFQF